MEYPLKLLFSRVLSQMCPEMEQHDSQWNMPGEVRGSAAPAVTSADRHGAPRWDRKAIPDARSRGTVSGARVPAMDGENLFQSGVERMRSLPRQILCRHPHRRLLRAPLAFAHGHWRQRPVCTCDERTGSCGKPLTGSLDSKYLLTSMLQCGKCGGTLEVRGRTHGRRRVHFYECSMHRRRGTAICRGLDVPMAKMDEELLTRLERDLMKPAVLRQACARLIAETESAIAETAGGRAKLLARKAQIERKPGRLAETLAGEDVAAPRAVLMAMKAREAEIGRIDRDLAAVDQAPGAPTSEAIAKRVDAALADWRGVLRRHPTLARQLLRKIVQGPLVVTPEALHEQPGYRVRGRASVEPLLTVELQRAGVGLHSKIVMDVHRLWRPQFCASWNQVVAWLKRIETVRQVA